MTNIESQTMEAQSRETKSAARIATVIVWILLGLMLLVFGLNGFLNFMPQPKDRPQEIINVMGALMNAGYMTVVSAVEVIVGVLLLTNRFVPLALALLAPIVVCILTFHIAMGTPLMATKGYGAAEVEQCYTRAWELSRQVGALVVLYLCYVRPFVDFIYRGVDGTLETGYL